MPSLKEERAATFEPIPPNLDVAALVEGTENFRYVERFPASLLNDPEQFESIVRNRVIICGRPIVIEGLQHKLAPWLYSPAWLEQNMGDQVAMIRDLETGQDQAWTIGHYLRSMSTFTRNFKPTRYHKGQRLYLKDMDVPKQWHDNLKDNLPPFLYYYNDGTGEYGGAGAEDDAGGRGRGVAVSGDLMSSLPNEFRAVNMLCYVGHEGTYTPAHREMCGSLGQNIMVEASASIDVNGNPTVPGSSLWFMTEMKDRFLVSEYWMSSLGHDIEIESHFASIDAWRRAPFNTYVVEQKVGDFILIPPLAPHQVWNRGTRTMKAAWNRTTVETLELAMSEAVPRARLVCRDEAYKNKSIIYYTLDKYANLLRRVGVGAMVDVNGRTADEIRESKKVRQLKRDFIRLFKLFDNIMLSEMFSPSAPSPNPQLIPYQSDVVCSYCRCNIFNRFLTCKECSLIDDEGGEDDDYDVCMDCFAMGRSCGCLSKQKWVEQWKWSELANKHEEWRITVIEIEGAVNEQSPQTLEVAQGCLGKKTLASVCQEQLKIRRKAKLKDPATENPTEEEPVVNKSGHAKRRKGRRSSGVPDGSSCHVCKVRHDNWKMAHCGCGKSYCYGNLYRAFDNLPMEIMEQPNWKCPFCRGICSCGQCRKDGKTKPYEPKLTCLGHDTKKIADPRSVESLVDFSRSNLTWLKSTAASGGSDETTRLKNIKEQSERDIPSTDILGKGENEAGNIQDLSMLDAPHVLESSMPSGIPIDPLLQADQSGSHVEPNAGHADPNLPRVLQHGPDAPPPRQGENQCAGDNSLLPSSPRTIDDPQPTLRYESPTEGDPTPYRALPSFASMMSNPEYDPQSSISPFSFSLPSSSQSPQPSVSNFIAPTATMISQGLERDGYGGGNPDRSELDDSQHQDPCVCDAAGSGNKPSSKKRKRKESGGTVQSDAQHQLKKSRRRSTLHKAKRDSNVHPIRAGQENKRPIIEPPVSPEHLSSLMQDDGQNLPSLGFDGSSDEHSQVLVTSDITPTATDFKTLALINTGFSAINGPLPGNHAGEEKHPASTKKRGGRLESVSSSLPPPKRPSGYKKPTKSRNELSGNSGDKGPMGVDDANPENGEESTPKKRRASAWLIRKNQGEPTDLPAELPTPQRANRSRGRKQSGSGRGANVRGTRNLLETNGDSDDSKPTTPSDGGPRKSHSTPDMPPKAPSEKQAGPTNGTAVHAAVGPVTHMGTQPKQQANDGDRVAKAYREGKLMAMRLAEGDVSEISPDSDYPSTTEENLRATAALPQKDSAPTPRAIKPAIKKSAGPFPSRLQGKNIRVISAKEVERRTMAGSASPSKAEKPIVLVRTSSLSAAARTTVPDGYSDTEPQPSSLDSGIPAHPNGSHLSNTRGRRNGPGATPHTEGMDKGKRASNRISGRRTQKLVDDREEVLLGDGE